MKTLNDYFTMNYRMEIVALYRDYYVDGGFQNKYHNDISNIILFLLAMYRLVWQK